MQKQLKKQERESTGIHHNLPTYINLQVCWLAFHTEHANEQKFKKQTDTRISEWIPSKILQTTEIYLIYFESKNNIIYKLRFMSLLWTHLI